MVSGTYNLNGATNVPINSKVAAYFSTEMDPLTFTTTTFTLKQGNTLIPGAVTYVGISATFIPTTNLAPNTEYTATITTGVKDLAGTPLAVNKVWTFTTGAAPDTTAPMVGNSIPANLQTGVALNSKISAIFGEAMDPLTLTTTTFTLNRGNTPVSGTVVYVGVTAVFVPAANLLPNTEYTATITTGAKDLAGNPLAVNKIWKFTTGPGPDITAPTVISTIPLTPASGLPINGKITATFSEVIDPLTVTTTTFTLMQGSTPVSGEVTYVGLTAIFTPDSFLAAGTAYTAMITTGVKDLAGNALAVNKVWTFTTFSSGGGGGGGGGDTTAPTVISTIPFNLASGVDIGTNISATFSEALNPLTVTNFTFTLKQGPTSVNGTVGYAVTTATFDPEDDLTPDTEYTATITIGVKDLAGNALAVNKVWTFRTEVVLSANPTAPIASSGLAAGTVLGETAGFVIIGHAAITASPPTATSVRNGDMGLIGHARSVYEGFTLTLEPREFAELTNGLFYANDDDGLGMPLPEGYASATAFLVQVQTDLGEAYTFLQGVNPTFPVPIALADTELGLRTLTRGVYNTGASVTISTGDLHLDAQGDPDSVWIFQIGTNLTTTSPGLKIWLDNGAKAENVYWVTGGLTSIGSGMEFAGNVFAGSSIAVGDGATVLGRLFAMTEGVTTISNTITGFNPIP